LIFFVCIFLRESTRSCYYIIQAVSKVLGLPVQERDSIAEFLSPLSPLYLQRGLNLSSRPTFPSLKSLREAVVERVSCGGVKWCRSNREMGGATRGGQGAVSPEISYVTRTEWMYAVLRASELGRQVSSLSHYPPLRKGWGNWWGNVSQFMPRL
jgi:hypothetical protein